MSKELNEYDFDDQMKVLKQKLTDNGFEVWLARDEFFAIDIFWNEIMRILRPKSIAWGDSMTLKSLGVIDELRVMKDIELIETFGDDLIWREQILNRKRALSSDIFLTGTNAITDCGKLVNLDMIGNRVAAIAFGPKNIVIFAGKNKIVSDINAAMERIKKVSAPHNARRHPEISTPCQKTGVCCNCNSFQRICNTWIITEKSFPKGRIKIILIDDDFGL